MDWKLLRKAYDLFVVFFVPFVQALQFEGKHNPEDADDQQSVRDHIDKGSRSKTWLPDNADTAKDCQYAESHIPAPVACPVAFQVHSVAG